MRKHFVIVTMKTYDELDNVKVRLHPDDIRQLIPDRPMYKNRQPDLVNGEQPTLCTLVRLNTGQLLVCHETAEDIEAQIHIIKNPIDERFNFAGLDSQLLLEDTPPANDNTPTAKRRRKKAATVARMNKAAQTDNYNDD